jgi:hypothetical protein
MRLIVFALLLETLDEHLVQVLAARRTFVDDDRFPDREEMAQEIAVGHFWQRMGGERSTSTSGRRSYRA